MFHTFWAKTNLWLFTYRQPFFGKYLKSLLAQQQQNNTNTHRGNRPLALPAAASPPACRWRCAHSDWLSLVNLQNKKHQKQKYQMRAMKVLVLIVPTWVPVRAASLWRTAAPPKLPNVSSGLKRSPGFQLKLSAYSYLSALLKSGFALSEIPNSFDSQNAYHKSDKLKAQKGWNMGSLISPKSAPYPLVRLYTEVSVNTPLILMVPFTFS